jgi:hypothetical protein
VKLRIQFSKSRSALYADAISHCKRFPTYREWDENGVRWHSVEMEDWESWQSIQRFVGNWKATLHFLNGEYANVYDLWDLWQKQKLEKERVQKIAHARVFADTAPKQFKFN